MHHRPGIFNLGRNFYISSEKTHTLPSRSTLENGVQFCGWIMNVLISEFQCFVSYAQPFFGYWKFCFSTCATRCPVSCEHWVTPLTLSCLSPIIVCSPGHSQICLLPLLSLWLAFWLEFCWLPSSNLTWLILGGKSHSSFQLWIDTLMKH